MSTFSEVAPVLNKREPSKHPGRRFPKKSAKYRELSMILRKKSLTFAT